MSTPLPPPELHRDAHKGDAGRVAAYVGSRTMPGAAILVARAAQRAGAGLVTLVVPDRALIAAIAPAAPEAVFMTLDGEGGAEDGARSLRAALELRADVRLVGCGRGHDVSTARLVGALIEAPVEVSLASPLIVDADGLNVLDGEPERLTRSAAPVVMTPHPGEAARLLRRAVGPGEVERQVAATELARRARGLVVLKGAGTLVADETRTWRAETGNPGMATAGAGDVLAGILAAYLCAARAPGTYSLFDAVCAAVYVHGVAGDLAAAALGERAVVASDLIAYLPEAQRLHRARAAVRGSNG